LAAVWRHLLGVDKIGIHDNFFNLGGHSLLVLNMVEKVRYQLQATIKVSDVFDLPTISGLATRLNISLEPTSQKDLYLEPIRSGSGAAVISISIHAHLLIDHLPEDIAIYWLKRDGMDTSTFRNLSVEDQATAYEKEILSGVSNQPLILVDYSHGGLLGYELVRRLRAHTDVHVDLVMVEPSFPLGFAKSDRALSDRFLKRIKTLRSQSNGGFIAFARNLTGFVDSSVRFRLATLISRLERRRVKAKLEQGKATPEQRRHYYAPDL
jgi:CheY-like chemotaxis protein